MAVKILPSDSIFREARDKVNKEIDEVIVCLKNKKTEMFNVINMLEEEFTNKQQQKQKEIDKLDNLIAQTEELGENNLLILQRDIIEKIEHEIEQLNIESIQGPDYDIHIKWGFVKKDFISKINNSRIQEIISISEESCSDESWPEEPVERETILSERGLRGDSIEPMSCSRDRGYERGWRVFSRNRRPRRGGRGRFRRSGGMRRESANWPPPNWCEEERRGNYWRNDYGEQKRPKSENRNFRRNDDYW